MGVVLDRLKNGEKEISECGVMQLWSKYLEGGGRRIRGVHDQLLLRRECEASLGYKRPCLKKEEERQCLRRWLSGKAPKQVACEHEKLT